MRDGAGGRQVTGAMKILAQAKARGRISEDEFRVLTSISPRFVDMLKDGLGMTARDLLGLAKEGQLTVHMIERAMS